MIYRCIHHTADPSTSPQFAKVQAYHNAGAGGKWEKGHGIQYHRLIEHDGMIVEAHPYSRICWHSGSDEWNKKSAGWCLSGDFRKSPPTEKQLASLYRLWRDEGFPLLVYHKEVRPDPTACPGNFDFRAALDSLRLSDLVSGLKIAEKAKDRLAGLRLGAVLRWIDRVKAYLKTKGV